MSHPIPVANFYTIQYGEGPDTPVWHFSIREQFDKAIDLIIGVGANAVIGTADVMEGDFDSDFNEFRAYVALDYPEVSED